MQLKRVTNKPAGLRKGGEGEPELCNHPRDMATPVIPYCCSGSGGEGGGPPTQVMQPRYLKMYEITQLWTVSWRGLRDGGCGLEGDEGR